MARPTSEFTVAELENLIARTIGDRGLPTLPYISTLAKS
jgi:hypothetical protein